MLDLIANVSDTGTQVFSFADQIDLIGFSGDEEGDDHSDEEGDDHSDEEGDDHSDEEGDDHSDEEGDDHSDEEGDDHSDEEGDDHSDEEGDDHGHEDGDDPHIWTDPTRIATAVEALEPIISGLAGVDAAALSTSISDYLDKLSALDASMDKALSAVPEAQRVLITNHEVFGYFADRYDFEVVGAIIPSLTSNAEPSAADIEELAEMIEAESIPAIFGETTQSTQLADALADEVDGAVAVVELFSESLGEDGSGAETYVGMMQLNADLITKALTP
ncbi:MAG: zinc/manganese transport system substrate-binding protein [Ilumatobacter sp.]|jgi:zinc/manganese transport system substrate-binding protein